MPISSGPSNAPSSMSNQPQSRQGRGEQRRDQHDPVRPPQHTPKRRPVGTRLRGRDQPHDEWAQPEACERAEHHCPSERERKRTVAVRAEESGEQDGEGEIEQRRGDVQGQRSGRSPRQPAAPRQTRAECVPHRASADR